MYSFAVVLFFNNRVRNQITHLSFLTGCGFGVTTSYVMLNLFQHLTLFEIPKRVRNDMEWLFLLSHGLCY